jgi:hypothetical protein
MPVQAARATSVLFVIRAVESRQPVCWSMPNREGKSSDLFRSFALLLAAFDMHLVIYLY